MLPYSDMGQVYLKVLKYKYFRILYVQDKHLQLFSVMIGYYAAYTDSLKWYVGVTPQ